MTNFCQYKNKKCQKCGHVALSDNSFRECRPPVRTIKKQIRKLTRDQLPEVPIVMFRWGDLVYYALQRFGITESLIKRITGKKECGCKSRRVLLNRAGAKTWNSIRNLYRKIGRFFTLSDKPKPLSASSPDGMASSRKIL